MLQWERELIRYRADKNWDAAHDLVSDIMDKATGSILGRAKMQAGFTLYAETPAHAPKSIVLTLQSLDLSDDDEELKVCATIQGIMYCLYAVDTEAAKRFFREAQRLMRDLPVDAQPYFSRLAIWLGYYYQTIGAGKAAERAFLTAIDWAKKKLSVHGEGDDMCMLRVARTSLAEVYENAGRRAEAMRELRKAVAIATSKAGPSLSYLRGRIAYGSGEYAEAERCLLEALDTSPERDHLFRLKVIECLANVLRDAGRIDEVPTLLASYRSFAKKGWMTRLLTRLQRLAIPRASKGGEMASEKGS